MVTNKKKYGGEYLVVSCDFSIYSFNNMKYRGLERIPDSFGKIEECALKRLFKLLSSSEDDNGFISSLSMARKIAQETRKHEDVEIIQCRIVKCRDGIDIKQYNDSDILGYDVSDFCDFSAIWNGLLGNLNKELSAYLKSLNENALFIKYKDAINFRRAYLSSPLSEKHVNLEIWQVAIDR